jgi:hypothetical protein
MMQYLADSKGLTKKLHGLPKERPWKILLHKSKANSNPIMQKYELERLKTLAKGCKMNDINTLDKKNAS